MNAEAAEIAECEYHSDAGFFANSAFIVNFAP
jgi:hypothetical protein